MDERLRFEFYVVLSGRVGERDGLTGEDDRKGVLIVVLDFACNYYISKVGGGRRRRRYERTRASGARPARAMPK